MSKVISVVATVAAAFTTGGASLAWTAIGFVNSVYGASQAKKQAAREQANQVAAQKAAYNASLQDRMGTRVAADSPAVYVYGRARVGSAVVAIFTSGARDEYKHLICIHAAHECDGIEEVYINGNALGALDGSGVPTTGKYAGKVRVKKHLGTPTDPADATLIAALPAKWFSTSVLRGYCYTYIRLDLNEREFQGGFPSVEVLLRGKKLYDPRDAVTRWSQNNALVTRDYLTSDICGVDAADLPSAQFITAANVCDEMESFGKKYTFNGTVTAAQDQAKILEQMAQSMAGSLVSTTWDIAAGKYIAPVMALDQSDIVGSVSITPGTSDASLYNGVRGQYISSETLYVSTDFTPYQNAAYVAADGRELWTNIDFPFTDAVQRTHNLARIFVEDQRNGYTVKAGFSLKAWGLKVGQRVTLTSPLFGWTSKIFRVTDKTYSPTSPVELTLKEDAAQIWDYSDAVTADETPNTGLPDPFLISAVDGLTLSSGTADLFVAGDGTVVSRIKVSWTAANNVFVTSNGHVLLQFKKSADSAWQDAAPVAGDATQTYTSSVDDGVSYDVRARFENSLGARGAWSTVSGYTVLGKSAAPSNVSNFIAQQQGFSVMLSCDAVTDSDLDLVEVRLLDLGDTNWLNGIPKTNILRGHSSTTASIPPGTWTLLAKAFDTSGNESATAARVDITVSADGYNTIQSVEYSTDWSGALTNFVYHWTGVLVPKGTLAAGSYTDNSWIDHFVPDPELICIYEPAEIDKGIDVPARIWGDIVSALGPGETTGLANPRLQVDYRLGAGSYDGFEDWNIGTVPFRHCKGKIILDTSVGVAKITGFRMVIDRQPVTEEKHGLTIAASGTAITFDNAFHSAPLISVFNDGTTPLLPTHTGDSATGSTLHLFNTSAADVGGIGGYAATGA